MPIKAWILAGATATGKSAVCQLIAERLGLSILSADSMLVYRGMEIGTAKPTRAEREKVPYHGIDLVTPDQPFSTGAWLDAARAALDSAEEQPPDKPLVVTGGTGLYLKALTSGLDARESDLRSRSRWKQLMETDGIEGLRRELLERLPACPASLSVSTNPRRLIRALEHLDASGRLPETWEARPNPVVTALTMPRDQLHQRILRRVKAMFAHGLTDEARHLRERYPQWSETASKAIGYAEALAVLDGRLTPEEAIEQTAARTRQLAKRQETWFRHQQESVWLEIRDGDCIEETAEKVLSLWHEHGTTEIRI